MKNIPEDKIIRDEDGNIILINDPRIFANTLAAARTWGMENLKQEFAQETDAIEQAGADFADKTIDLRAKYELSGPLLEAKSESEIPFLDEMNALLLEYRVNAFLAAFDYVEEPVAIDLILDVLPDSKKKLD